MTTNKEIGAFHESQEARFLFFFVSYSDNDETALTHKQNKLSLKTNFQHQCSFAEQLSVYDPSNDIIIRRFDYNT